MNQSINQIAQEVFLLHTAIDFRTENRDANFFSKELNIKPRDLVLVFMDLQNRLGIKIESNSLILYNFSTYNNVINILKTTCGFPN